MAQVIPYFNFDSNCREAMKFYQDCFGGELRMQTVSEMPEMAAQMPEHLRDAILHGELSGGAVTLYGSDLNRNERREGNTIQLCILCGSAEDQDKYFGRLGDGGDVLQPIADMPWGARYGEVIDRYGKTWLLNYQKA